MNLSNNPKRNFEVAELDPVVLESFLYGGPGKDSEQLLSSSAEMIGSKYNFVQAFKQFLNDYNSRIEALNREDFIEKYAYFCQKEQVISSLQGFVGRLLQALKNKEITKENVIAVVQDLSKQELVRLEAGIINFNDQGNEALHLDSQDSKLLSDFSSALKKTQSWSAHVTAAGEIQDDVVNEFNFKRDRIRRDYVAKFYKYLLEARNVEPSKRFEKADQLHYDFEDAVSYDSLSGSGKKRFSN